MAGLDEEFVGEDGLVGGGVRPAFFVQEAGGDVGVVGLLQPEQPVAEEAEPKVGEAAVVVLDDGLPIKKGLNSKKISLGISLQSNI